MYQVIATPFLDEGFLVLRPGSERGMRIPAGHYEQLRDLSARAQPVPGWLASGISRAWGLDLPSLPVGEVVLVRAPSAYGFGRASWELNLGCNYDCENCYLDIKRFEGPWPGTSGWSCCTSCATPGWSGCS